MSIYVFGDHSCMYILIYAYARYAMWLNLVNNLCLYFTLYVSDVSEVLWYGP